MVNQTHFFHKNGSGNPFIINRFVLGHDLKAHNLGLDKNFANFTVCIFFVLGEGLLTPDT